MANNLVISKVLDERNQRHSTRRQLFTELEEQIGRPVVTFFTSFRYPAAIDDSDVEMLEDSLRTLNLSKGVAIMISSPGGSGLAAERIINLLRSYSDTNEYWAIVPAKAKSAATMICLGASKILMGSVSELGPIDPQVLVQDTRVSVHHFIDKYHELFRAAVAAQGNIEPYLQQLADYDARVIGHLEAERDLAADIAVKYLQVGMLSGTESEDIKSKMKVFLLPEHTKTHGRPIYYQEARDCGLEVELVDVHSETWQLVYELYIRTREFVSRGSAKAMETATASFHMPVSSSQEV